MEKFPRANSLKKCKGKTRFQESARKLVNRRRCTLQKPAKGFVNIILFDPFVDSGIVRADCTERPTNLSGILHRTKIGRRGVQRARESLVRPERQTGRQKTEEILFSFLPSPFLPPLTFPKEAPSYGTVAFCFDDGNPRTCSTACSSRAAPMPDQPSIRR